MATSYIDLYVPASSSLTEDSAFIFYLYLEDNIEGVLFHFQGYDPNAENVLSGIHVSFSGAAVMFDFFCQSSTWSGGNDSLTAVLNAGRYTCCISGQRAIPFLLEYWSPGSSVG